MYASAVSRAVARFIARFLALLNPSSPSAGTGGGTGRCGTGEAQLPQARVLPVKAPTSARRWVATIRPGKMGRGYRDMHAMPTVWLTHAPGGAGGPTDTMSHASWSANGAMARRVSVNQAAISA